MQTVESGGMPGHVCLETSIFTEHGDTTTVTQNTIYQSAQDRDRVLRYDTAQDIHGSIERPGASADPARSGELILSCAVSSGAAVWQDLIEQAAWRSP
ncbi:MAG TPA: hypothetical protein VFV73_06155 [Streptosporangiaceae bacterium]|nr:hypothetical protein [Streptosporangiaceae bacterium]